MVGSGEVRAAGRVLQRQQQNPRVFTIFLDATREMNLSVGWTLLFWLFVQCPSFHGTAAMSQTGESIAMSPIVQTGSSTNKLGRVNPGHRGAISENKQTCLNSSCTHLQSRKTSSDLEGDVLYKQEALIEAIQLNTCIYNLCVCIYIYIYTYIYIYIHTYIYIYTGGNDIQEYPTSPKTSQPPSPSPLRFSPKTSA